MEIRTAKRLEHFQTGIFTALNAKKDELVASGKKVYNLFVGTPDFPVAPHVQQALIDAATATLKAYVDTQDQAISADVVQRYNYLLGLIQQLTEFPGVVADPTWGSARPIKMVVDRVYDFDRPFSVTAKDYDGMGYTAKAYDAKGVTAREYDVTFAMRTYNDWIAKEG